MLVLANYTFGTKEAQPEEDASVLSRLNRLQEHYEKYGMRRSCEAILIVPPPWFFRMVLIRIAGPRT